MQVRANVDRNEFRLITLCVDLAQKFTEIPAVVWPTINILKFRSRS
jgi:hypothetical protein